jgi:hypothetical protein
MVSEFVVYSRIEIFVLKFIFFDSSDIFFVGELFYHNHWNFILDGKIRGN